MKLQNESIETFLARGGKVAKVPYQEPVLKVEYMKVSTKIDVNSLSLTEGELFFAEVKPKKPGKSKLLSLLEKYDLPEDMKQRLRDGVNNV